ncbi:hypothetical protein NC651_040016 [Populus alba x Populus x berolinensis]|uniref:Uncharacterized protein n=1 Tax=Populus alba x Populus x berolinensis TaxID=444605 RepID=A0AAD6MBM1_9ROSI|nr:hypothetical protein NC651_040016 [Populus alba x Populus x berolinensis]KAJ6975408.1 hypothetical protein NC653_031300 [Populus alba x Populus x berolinensis]KAJ6982532.1 hypothetical protein NC653_025597 [Populus alba x Populus x berolinensis]KAJ6982533.1 hypothetical protein NC653_025597 [Populus alba x Populus x berolinensis]KAJ6988086.1 hypothetical protein NC653_021112 [Populus alba x Populus x berolinensis]
MEGDDWLLLAKDVPALCSRWSQVCCSAGRVVDTVLRRIDFWFLALFFCFLVSCRCLY